MDPRKQSIDRPLTHRYPVNEETNIFPSFSIKKTHFYFSADGSDGTG